MLAQGPTCALARVSYMTSTRAKAHNKRYLSGPILHRDMAPFYSAIDTWWTALRTGAAILTGSAAFYAFSILPLTEVYAILFAGG